MSTHEITSTPFRCPFCGGIVHEERTLREPDDPATVVEGVRLECSNCRRESTREDLEGRDWTDPRDDRLWKVSKSAPIGVSLIPGSDGGPRRPSITFDHDSGTRVWTTMAHDVPLSEVTDDQLCRLLDHALRTTG